MIIRVRIPIEKQCVGPIWNKREEGTVASFSWDGQWYARYNGDNDLDIFSFDRCSGILNNFSHVTIIDSADVFNSFTGLAFSPSSRFLYISSVYHVYQFDLWSNDIASTRIVVGNNENTSGGSVENDFWLAGLAGDGRIYIHPIGSVEPWTYLHAIEYPDRKGQTCGMRYQFLDYPTINCWTIPYFPNYRLGPIDGSLCDTLGLDNVPWANYRWGVPDTSNYLEVEFIDLSAYEPSEYRWDFGDGGISMARNPVHKYADEGKYTVCLLVKNENGENSKCREIELGKTVDVDKISRKFTGIQLFPNPLQDVLHVEFPFPEDTRFTLYGEKGNIVLSEKMVKATNSYLFQTRHLAPGIYFYNFISKSGFEASGKVLKVK